jgi:hypothetical protein
MQNFSTMAQQMQNIAAPGKMPMATMQGRGPIAAPAGPGIAAPAAPQAPGAGGDQIMQMIQMIAQQIEAMTGVPATSEQIQAALAQVMPGAGAGAGEGPPGVAAPAPGGGAQPMVPPQLGMRR